MTTSNEHNNAPAVPQDMRIVPVWLLERVERSLGAFTSDEGWAQTDMDTMDSVSALIAAAPAPAQEPTPWAWLTEANIDDYLADYEMRGEGEDGCDGVHAPTDGERVLIKDAIMGLLNEAHEATRALRHAAPAQEVGLTDEALDNLIEDLSEWSRHVVEDTAHKTLEAHVREVLAKNPIIAALRAKGQS